MRIIWWGPQTHHVPSVPVHMAARNGHAVAPPHTTRCVPSRSRVTQVRQGGQRSRVQIVTCLPSLSALSLFILGHICDSSSQLECYGAGVSGGGGGTTPLLGSHEALEDEIKRLRERLHTVESENQALNTKLSQQQWDLENRLAEIEMQICGVSSTSSVDPDNEAEELERNRESII